LVRKVGSAFARATASRFFLSSSPIAFCEFTLASDFASCHGRASARGEPRALP
jgi:hypothetical protein